VTDPSHDEDAEALVRVPIPPLANLLVILERAKGSPLSREEVLRARDEAICITMRLSMKRQMDERRGYRDLDLENVWEEWQLFRMRGES
jgi:hypothetical protein